MLKVHEFFFRISRATLSNIFGIKSCIHADSIRWDDDVDNDDDRHNGDDGDDGNVGNGGDGGSDGDDGVDGDEGDHGTDGVIMDDWG